MKSITQTIKDRYYRYQPNEFVPIYEDGGNFANKRQFHLYKLRNWKLTYYQLTHFAG